jgi:hypothetical protein
MSIIHRIARQVAETADLADTANPATGAHEPVIEDYDQLAAFIEDGIRAYLAQGVIVTAEDLTYTPVIEKGGIGYVVTGPTGHRQTVTVVPSTATNEGPGTGNVFVYHSDNPAADPLGEAHTHIVLNEDDTAEDDHLRAGDAGA